MGACSSSNPPVEAAAAAPAPKPVVVEDIKLEEPEDKTTVTAMAAMEAGGQLQKYEYEAGPLGDGQVELDVTHCGICHSDKSMLDNAWGMCTDQYPIVAGHEAVGTVARVGKNVKHLKVGQLVGVGWHSSYCHTCSSCLSGDHQLCLEAAPTILMKGGFANKMRADAFSAVPIPDGLDPALVGPMFCGGITVFWPFVEYEICPTSKVGVIGIGGLGHLALMFANAWGCEVTAFTSSERKMEEAKTMGAHKTINSRDPEAIKAAAGTFDLIINTTNVKLDWDLYIAALALKGRLHMQGAVLDPLEINNFGLIMGQKVVSGSPVGSPAVIKQMLDFAARHKIAPVVEKFKLSDVNAAMKHLEEGKAHYRIVLENDL